MTDLPAWMAYASTSELEEYTFLEGERKTYQDTASRITERMHTIKFTAKARVQRRNRQASQLAAE
tara:strand:- start:31498 stop:31692 length:195 start_codon:yes stop_codon:yes gene_type:complete